MEALLAPDPLQDSPDSLAHLRTMVANRGVGLHGQLGFRLSALRFAKAWSVEVTVSNELSTGAGVRSRQHLVLVPLRAGLRSLVVGTICPILRTARIRSYSDLAVAFRGRMGSSYDIMPGDHARFVMELTVMLEASGLTVEVERPSPWIPTHAPSVESRTSTIAAAAIAVVALVAASALWLSFVTPHFQ